MAKKVPTHLAGTKIPGSEQGANVPVSLVVNQYIQFVSAHSAFPEASILDTYSPEDREWIKKRTELEQENRHRTFALLIEGEHKIEGTKTQLRFEIEHRAQLISGAIISLGILLSFVLLMYGLEKSGLILAGLIIGFPLSANVLNRFYKKTKDQIQP